MKDGKAAGSGSTARKGKRDLSSLIILIVYLVLWAGALLVFWIPSDLSKGTTYEIYYMWLALPIGTYILSFVVGRANAFGKWKWLLVPIFGVMYMLAEYLTLQLSNMLYSNSLEWPHFELILITAAITALGILLGSAIRRMQDKVAQQKIKEKEQRWQAAKRASSKAARPDEQKDESAKAKADKKP